MMKRETMIAAVVLCVSLSPGQASPHAPVSKHVTAGGASPLIYKAKRLISSHLIDPSSVQFRDLRIASTYMSGSKVTVVCGQYNARNKMGGYAGFSKFAYEPSVLRGVASMGDEADFFGDDGGDFGELTGDGVQAYKEALAACRT